MAQIHIKADTTAEMATTENNPALVEGGSCEKVEKGAKGLKDIGAQCAGEWTNAIAWINEPSFQNMMVIRNATSLQDAVRRAARCRADARNVTFYSPAVVACAPYIACN